jgi:hypothetical protein
MFYFMLFYLDNTGANIPPQNTEQTPNPNQNDSIVVGIPPKQEVNAESKATLKKMTLPNNSATFFCQLKLIIYFEIYIFYQIVQNRLFEFLFLHHHH